jgi:hypothetical protein
MWIQFCVFIFALPWVAAFSAHDLLRRISKNPSVQPKGDEATIDVTTTLNAVSRRGVLAGTFVGSQLIASRAWADDSSSVLSQLVSPQAASLELGNGLLESRVQSNVLNPPPYGMEGTDVFYPS